MRIVSTLCVDVIGQSCSYQMLLLPLSKTIFIHSVSLKPRSIEDTMGTPVEAAAVEWGRSGCKGRGTMRIVSTLCVDVIGQSCSYQMLLLPLSKTIFIHSVSLKPRSIEDTMGTPVEAAAGRSECKGRGTMRIVSTLCVDVIGQSCSYQMLLLPLSKTIFIHSVSLKPRSIEDTMGTPVEAAAVEWVAREGVQCVLSWSRLGAQAFGRVVRWTSLDNPRRAASRTSVFSSTSHGAPVVSV
ncbi:hypothetical protein J6590_073241 [Homalodisca vitripennis]|nr:hypothetical protein J6590_073241 [Homalodisca vitripennis]